MGVAANSDDTVHELAAGGSLTGTQAQPAHSAGAIRADISTRGSGDGVHLGSQEVDVALGAGDLELWHAVGVEEMVAGERDGRAQTLELEGGIGDDEGRGRVGAQQGRCLDVERDVLLVESLGGELVKGLDGQGLRALAGVQGGDVVEHGDSSGSRGLRVHGIASVVLEAEAEKDVLERCAVEWLGQLLFYFSKRQL